MAIRVGVVGAAGRMGSTVCAAVEVDPALELVAAIDPTDAGTTASGVKIANSLQALADAGAEVADDFAVLRGAFRESNCIVASNFAVSAVLMMRFAELAAPYFETAEIIELHHDSKIDAPSGTAVTTAARMAAASDDWAADPTKHEVVAGARGGVGPAGIRVHAVRMRGMVAHQEVILGAAGQTLTIRQDSYDRLSYMPGVLLACKHVSEHPGLTIGLDAFLNL
jgi:4-hydroxy-tetrahydrodipicolinate reductase